MATKKQNKRYIVRRIRRLLKDVSKDVGHMLSGNKANKSGWGSGCVAKYPPTDY